VLSNAFKNPLARHASRGYCFLNMLEKPPRPRKSSERKSERTREHLLAVCQAEFARRGFEACTMRQLADAAEMSAAAFYYYFASKEEIVAAFYQRSLAAHLGRAQALIKPGASVAENLRRVIESRFAELANDRSMLKILRRYAFETDHLASPFHHSHRAIREASVNLFADILVHAHEPIPAQLRREVAQALWLFHLGVLGYWISDESPQQQRTHDLLDAALTALDPLVRLLCAPGVALFAAPILHSLHAAGLLEDL
jgi:AcrR family transcriptional regulator